MSKYCPNKHYPVWCDQETKRQWCYPKSETPNKPDQFCTFKKDSLIREFMESERISRRRDAYSYFQGKTPTKQRSKWVPPLPPAMYFNQAALDPEEPLKQLFMDVNVVSKVNDNNEDDKSIDTRTALFNVMSKDPMILSIEVGDVVTTYPFTESDEKRIIKHIDMLEKYAPKDKLFQFLWVKGRLFDGTEGLVNMKNLYIESRIAMFAYTATDKEELSFKAGDHLYIQDKSKGDWWLACNVKKPQISGYVPANYLAICVTAITNGDNYKKNSNIYIQELANGHLQGTNEVGDTFLIDESLLLFPRCEEDLDSSSDSDSDEEIKKEAQRRLKIEQQRQKRKTESSRRKIEMKPAAGIDELMFGLPGM